MCALQCVRVRVRVCAFELAWRRIARRNNPGCMLHDGPLQPVPGATWHAGVRLWVCAAPHAKRCTARGKRISRRRSALQPIPKSASVSSRVLLVLRVLHAGVVAWLRCCALARPTCTRPGPRCSRARLEAPAYSLPAGVSGGSLRKPGASRHDGQTSAGALQAGSAPLSASSWLRRPAWPVARGHGCQSAACMV